MNRDCEASNFAKVRFIALQQKLPRHWSWLRLLVVAVPSRKRVNNENIMTTTSPTSATTYHNVTPLHQAICINSDIH